jgi:hypothetical protein
MCGSYGRLFFGLFLVRPEIVNSLFTVGEIGAAYIYTFTSDLGELREQDKGV